MSDTSNKSLIGIVVVVIAIGAAAAFFALTRPSEPPPAPDKQYFYDMGDGRLFPVDITLKPPVAPPSQTTIDGRPGGVKAYVFTCGACTEDEQFVGYITVTRNDSDPRGASYARESTMLVAEPNPDDTKSVKWANYDTAINAINAKLKERCGGTMPTECRPTK